MRVVVDADYPSSRAAVALHVGVGFRDEGPGEEGLAHLFEHLMFRGSASVPGGAFGDAVYGTGGLLSGTTHHDYTDYLQVVPATELRRALFRDADRLCAPSFNPTELALQLAGITQEILHARDLPPLGGFPWPLVSRVISAVEQFAHDGYGDLERLGQVTPDDCRRFFETHYAPSNVVLTVVCPQPASEVLPWIDAEFSCVSARGAGARARPSDPPPEVPGGEAWTSTGLTATSTSVAFRLPDPRDDLNGYLATVVLADLLSQGSSTAVPEAQHISARCGVFGMLDSRDPDVLLATVTTVGASGDQSTPPEAVTRVVDAIAAVGRGAAPAPQVAAAAARAAYDVAHRQSDLGSWCRTLGRLEFVLGDAAVAAGLPRSLASVSPADVVAAAARLVVQPPRWVSVGPGVARTRPASGAGSATHAIARPATVSAVDATCLLHSKAARPCPPTNHAPAAVALDATERATTSGIRVVAARDSRAELCELRLRVPLGPAGWQSPGLAGSVWHRALDLSGIAALRTIAGVAVRIHVTGQWADVTAACPRSDLDRAVLVLVRALAAVADQADPIVAAALPYVPPNHEQLLTDVLRLAWTASSPPGTSVLSPSRATFVVVGADDPRRIAAAVESMVAAYVPSQTPDDSPGPGQPPVITIPLDDFSAHRPAGAPLEDYVELMLSGPEAQDGPLDAARYLATALLGGSPVSRLSDWCRGFETRVVDMSVGRDLLGPHRRTFVRIRTPARLAAQSVEVVRQTIDNLADVPPPGDDLRKAAAYAHAQLLSTSDSPAFLADALRHTLSAGRSLDWVLGRSSALLTVTAGEVSDAAALFRGAGHSMVSLGRFNDEALVSLASSWWTVDTNHTCTVGNCEIDSRHAQTRRNDERP
ncbi:hypothetical protein C5C18_14805 [Rathayibacter tritici]|nr:hypothetical protein C5C21_14705 [Rathayibacter tritici]PPG02181.1 hypothetical protein C5C18_14805 [Rathayibacter tritici]PPI19322.1 hypothetical protein C5D07_01995 [Rathayibacter tritici]